MHAFPDADIPVVQLSSTALRPVDDPLQLGAALVLIMRWKPRGFVTRREPSVILKEKKAIPTDLVAEGHG